ncbi:hypothetical protein BP00DRAFT_414854 [Aspergillus indologenus CBS 114.80]|uniref:Uncharacterized protein n=1 Tax=Aspergillus indologenus CBS 114.80 TaxID=1450541 RepID=A0A2V5I6H4_9EURO|nr:hypothetical protein BP00DRAFT_414854 [Aspergillus indologenus CBS 114.80]
MERQLCCVLVLSTFSRRFSSNRYQNNFRQKAHSTLTEGVTLRKQQSDYIALNNQAVSAEAKAELDSLAARGCRAAGIVYGRRLLLGIWPQDDRPFRLYCGCWLVLRGNEFFNRAFQILQYRARSGTKGASYKDVIRFQFACGLKYRLNYGNVIFEGLLDPIREGAMAQLSQILKTSIDSPTMICPWFADMKKLKLIFQKVREGHPMLRTWLGSLPQKTGIGLDPPKPRDVAAVPKSPRVFRATKDTWIKKRKTARIPSGNTKQTRLVQQKAEEIAFQKEIGYWDLDDATQDRVDDFQDSEKFTTERYGALVLGLLTVFTVISTGPQGCGRKRAPRGLEPPRVKPATKGMADEDEPSPSKGLILRGFSYYIAPSSGRKRRKTEEEKADGEEEEEEEVAAAAATADEAGRESLAGSEESVALAARALPTTAVSSAIWHDLANTANMQAIQMSAQASVLAAAAASAESAAAIARERALTYRAHAQAAEELEAAGGAPGRDGTPASTATTNTTDLLERQIDLEAFEREEAAAAAFFAGP